MTKCVVVGDSLCFLANKASNLMTYKTHEIACSVHCVVDIPLICIFWIYLQTQTYNTLNFFVEDQIYWAPADTATDLYQQLASKKYREIPRTEIT